jgi:eukaryotic-like serine/threonine-protein kinase
MPALPIGSTLEDYEVVGRAATGGMSEVYQARHLPTGVTVAIKMLLKEWREDGELVARFRNEARTLDHARHPHIVTLRSRGSLPDGLPFMILEWLPFHLGQVLAADSGPMPPSTALRAAAQIAEALACLHDHGFVHRDLKPANVLFAEPDLAIAETKLRDLGLAKAFRGIAAPPPLDLQPVSTGGSATLGTWEYMAPEQWSHSKTAGPPADVYSLGVLLFHMIAGCLPFLAEQPKDWMYLHIIQPAPMRLIDDVVSPATRDFIAQMLSKTSVKRPGAREIADALRRFAEQA